MTIPTRKSSTTEFIITDLHSFYHPPTSLDPLEVDANTEGEDSDHNLIILPPLAVKSNEKRKKKKIKTRPLPQSGFHEFGEVMTGHEWNEVTEPVDVNTKVKNFHDIIKTHLDKIFPEKIIQISSLDKKWMTPALKQLHRKVKREYFHHKKSLKWKKLKSKFKKMKKRTVRKFYSNFVEELKHTTPAKWYTMVKKLGLNQSSDQDDLKVESLIDKDNKEAAESVANFFASVSQEYLPRDNTFLPSSRKTSNHLATLCL